MSSPDASTPDPAAAAAAAEAAAAAMRQFTIEAWTLLAFGIVVTILRTYARIKAVGVKRLQADDFLVWIGVVSSVLCLVSRLQYTYNIQVYMN